MNKSKVAIHTQYNNAINYGGLLQAYALHRVISKQGYDVKVLDLEHASFEKGFKAEVQRRNFFLKVCYKIKYELKKCYYRKKYSKDGEYRNKWDMIAKRPDCVTFRELIPHSEIVNASNIKDIEKQFDIFVCGSDQIWNPRYSKGCDFLDYVAENKVKFAYAPSVAKYTLSNEEADFYAEKLKKLDYISVRETSSIPLLQKLTPQEVVQVLDPTLLLKGDEWAELAEVVLTDEPYVFVYILGKDKKIKDLTRKILSNIQIKSVFLPLWENSEFGEIENIGDLSLYNISPQKFLGLIKNAECVITDSFHAVVFSIIFNREFWVLNRDNNNGGNSMISRIGDLLKLFQLEERYVLNFKDFINKKDRKITYSEIKPIIEKKREGSLLYLKSALTGGKKGRID